MCVLKCSFILEKILALHLKDKMPQTDMSKRKFPGIGNSYFSLHQIHSCVRELFPDNEIPVLDKCRRERVLGGDDRGRANNH